MMPSSSANVEAPPTAGVQLTEGPLAGEVPVGVHPGALSSNARAGAGDTNTASAGDTNGAAAGVTTKGGCSKKRFSIQTRLARYQEQIQFSIQEQGGCYDDDE